MAPKAKINKVKAVMGNGFVENPQAHLLNGRKDISKFENQQANFVKAVTTGKKTGYKSENLQPCSIIQRIEKRNSTSDF